MNLADDAVGGLMCSWCGVYFEKEHGYPVLCKTCWNRGTLIHHNGKWHEQHPGFQKAIHKEL